VTLLRRVAVLLAASTSACGACGHEPPGPEGGAAPTALVEPPVPTPDGLLAEGWVQTPDVTWAQVQHDVSGVVALLPPAAGEVVCSLVGIDAGVARRVDGTRPWYAVVGTGEAGGDVVWVAALPLTGPRVTDPAVLDGADPGGGRYTARDVGGAHVLVSDAGTPSVWWGVVASWLVLASAEKDFARLGPYAYRTMPTKAAPGSAAMVATVLPGALAGTVSAQLSARWEMSRAWLAARDEEQRAKHGGRAPDFGDPRPILDAVDVAVKRRIALVTHATAARLELTAQDGDVRADLFLTPGPGEAGAGLVARLHPGDARPLGDLPAEVLAAVLTREDEASRTDDGRDVEAALDGALGTRAHPEDTAALHAALDDWERARGEWLTGGLAWGGAEGARGVVVRTPSAGGDGAARAVRELLDLSHRPAFEAQLSGSMHLGPAAVAPADVPSVSKASLARFAARGGGEGHPSPPLGVAWGLHDGELLLAAGGAATGLLASEAAPAKRLGDEPRMGRLLAGLGADATLALVAQPLRFDPVRAGSDEALAPLAIAWGRKGGDAWLRVELAGALLRELIRLKAGL